MRILFKVITKTVFIKNIFKTYFKMKIQTKFLILCFILVKLISSLNICDRTPRWRLSGQRFPADFSGKLKLIALLAASCPFCRKQTKR